MDRGSDPDSLRIIEIGHFIVLFTHSFTSQGFFYLRFGLDVLGRSVLIFIKILKLLGNSNAYYTGVIAA